MGTPKLVRPLQFALNLRYMDHSREFLKLVEEARTDVREVSVEDTQERVADGAVLIDVREDNEYAAGHAAGAEHIGRGVIERDIVSKHPEKGEELILYCGGGYRSALAAESLAENGLHERLVDGRAAGRRGRKRVRPLNRKMTDEEKRSYDEKRARTREFAAEFAEEVTRSAGSTLLYKESGGDTEKIPWADMVPNRFFKEWAESTDLKGDGRRALVMGCGLGDDAKYLHDLGFKVTGFDISPTAVEWARRIYGDTGIQFETADLFEPYRGWLGAFDFVLEIYTIQPLPMEMRPRVMDAVAAFVAPGGRLLVVTRGRGER